MATKTFKRYEVGTEVAVEDGFTGEIHYGKVVSVKVLQNGYPETTVDFPSKNGTRVWAVEKLMTPTELVQHIKEREAMLSMYRR